MDNAIVYCILMKRHRKILWKTKKTMVKGFAGARDDADAARLPGDVFILCFEIATKLYKAPFAHYITASYGKQAAPVITGVVASSQYLLQFVSALWGALTRVPSRHGLRRVACVRSSLPACLCCRGQRRAVIVTFNVATVLSGLRVAARCRVCCRQVSDSIATPGRKATQPPEHASDHGMRSSGVLTGVGTEKIIEGLRPELPSTRRAPSRNS